MSQNRSAIDLPESGYGSTQAALIGVSFKTLSELKGLIRSRRWRRSGDNPGQMYAQSCELVMIENGDYDKMAVLKVSNHFDV